MLVYPLLISWVCYLIFTFDDKLPTVIDALRLVFIVKTFGPSIAIRVVVFYFKFIEANNLFYSSLHYINSSYSFQMRSQVKFKFKCFRSWKLSLDDIIP